MEMQASHHNCFRFVLLTLLLIFSMTGIVYAQNLDVGEPRTVRLIYFQPNNSNYRYDVIEKMKMTIRSVQTFYAKKMQAHGHGNITFRFETEAWAEPKVHDVKGQHPSGHYKKSVGQEVIDEVGQSFDLDANIYFIVLSENSLGDSNGRSVWGVGERRDKDGGVALVSYGFSRERLAHELGHAFGLQNDFRGAYTMSDSRPGPLLSECAADFLSVHPYFNAGSSIAEGQPPTIELLSPLTYPAGTGSVSVQLRVSDSDRVHQLILFAMTMKPHSAAGQPEVVACRTVENNDGIVEFLYNGKIPSASSSSLSNPVVHQIMVSAVDINGDVSERVVFRLSEKSALSINTINEDTESGSSVAFSPDGTTLASVVGNGEEGSIIQLRDIESGRSIKTFSEHGGVVHSVSFSSDGRYLASGSSDSKIIVWDVVRGVAYRTFSERDGVVHSVSFSPDGRYLASGSSDSKVIVWDVVRGVAYRTFSEHDGVVHSVSFSPDGRYLASGSSDSKVKLWNVENGRNIATLDHGSGVESVAFSLGGTVLAAGTTLGTVELWNVATKARIDTLGATSSVVSVVFLSDWTTLASGTADGEIQLWEVASLHPQPPIGYRDKITISEIMIPSNNGSLPQWIELHNRSDTYIVNLKDWTLEVQNRQSVDFDGDQNVTLTFKEKSIKPQETLLIVSKQGRSSNNFQNEQIYNLSTLHPNLQDTLLSEGGFYLKLKNAAGELIDEVGNIDGKSDTNDVPAWHLPKGMTEDGARASMIRRHDDEIPLPGTEEDSWVSALYTELVTGTTAYYGHPDDIGAPGIKSGGALPVTLSHFRANHTGTGVVVKWITESELDNAGFNILRSDNKNGKFKIVNSKLIQGAGTTNERHTYTWTDTTAKPNVAYYYQIEEVSHAGARKQLATVRMRGLIFASGKLTTRWSDLKLQK